MEEQLKKEQLKIKFKWLLVVFLPILFGDILLKWWVQAYLYPYFPFYYPYGGVGVFKDFLGIQFSIVYETNQGAAWGLFSNFPYALVIARVVIITVLFFYFFLKKMRPLELLGLCMILAGAFGNVLDFFIYGAVIDMFKFVFWKYQYPIFNIADSAILIGIVVYFVAQLKKSK